jgi:hypothetical protein
MSFYVNAADKEAASTPRLGGGRRAQSTLPMEIRASIDYESPLESNPPRKVEQVDGCPTKRHFVSSLDELVASRRAWIEEILKPWCRQASLADLKRAELEWAELAGRIDAQSTLWTWAWGRFPDLIHEPLAGVNETHEVAVTLADGSEYVGYPDNRKSQAGRLVLSSTENGPTRRLVEHGPWPIDTIAAVTRLVEK